ncbi:glycosyltransferase family 4 protein [Vibrio sp. F13]|uniref:glycosyltransferase n=1 Tax=unclassified Vibrio TaxID=2614977 RepID=UPI0010BDB747|nr:glycosyltransferase [Vibrio sp. F13]TKF91873.1 glycosyltransferase family 4 protein [Vibrio sp. F13]
MKTISIITPHYAPENTACSNRIRSIANYFENENLVNVVTLSEMGVNNKIPDYHIGNLNIRYLKHGVYNKSNFISRLFCEFFYCLKLLFSCKKSDITIVTTPFLLLIPLSWFFIKGKKVLDIRDIVWGYLPNFTYKQRLVKWLLSKLCETSIHRYNTVLVTNKNELAFIDKLGFKGDILLVPNGISLEKYNFLCNLKDKTTEGETRVLYVGNVGLAQELDILIDLAEHFDNVKFDIVGAGSDMNRIKSIVSSKNLKNVIFHGSVDWNDLLSFYESSDVLYASLGRDYSSAMPSKLYEYASMRKKIFFVGNGVAHDFVSDLDNAISVSHDELKVIDIKFSELVNKNKVESDINRELIKDNFIREYINESLEGIIR